MHHRGQETGELQPHRPARSSAPFLGHIPILPTSCCLILLNPGVFCSITHGWDEDPAVSSSAPLMPTLLRASPMAAPSPVPHRAGDAASPRGAGCSGVPAAAPVSWLPCTAPHKQALSEECGAGAWPPRPAPHLWRGQGRLSSLAASLQNTLLVPAVGRGKGSKCQGVGLSYRQIASGPHAPRVQGRSRAGGSFRDSWSRGKTKAPFFSGQGRGLTWEDAEPCGPSLPTQTSHNCRVLLPPQPLAYRAVGSPSTRLGAQRG